MRSIIIQTLNGVNILLREDGIYGLEIIDGESGATAYRYRSLESAQKIAQAISAENDASDAYEARWATPTGTPA